MFSAVDYISAFSIMIPTLVGIIIFSKLPNTLRVLCLFVFATGVLEAITSFIYLDGGNNLFLFHIYTFIEFTAISIIYYRISTSGFRKRLILVLSAVFIVLSVLNLFGLEMLSEFNSNQRAIESIVLLVYFLGYFTQLLGVEKYPFLENHPYFILTVGFAVYFVGTALLFLLADYLIEHNMMQYWQVHSYLNIFLNIIYSIVLWRGSKLSRLL